MEEDTIGKEETSFEKNVAKAVLDILEENLLVSISDKTKTGKTFIRLKIKGTSPVLLASWRIENSQEDSDKRIVSFKDSSKGIGSGLPYKATIIEVITRLAYLFKDDIKESVYFKEIMEASEVVGKKE